MHGVHCCLTVDYQQIANDNIANQIHGFTIDYGKFILNRGYYTVARRYEFYVRVARTISHE